MDFFFKSTLIYHTFYLITGLNPLQLIVTLKGELKVAFSSVAGIYIRGPNARYETWIQEPGTNAIWHNDGGGFNKLHSGAYCLPRVKKWCHVWLDKH